MDCDNLDLAADCYRSALEIRHTRAHQGLARVYYLKNERSSAYEEMTKLIEKAQSNASAYEKRSEYCERTKSMADLSIVTQLDPVRTYPYRYRAAGKFNMYILSFQNFAHWDFSHAPFRGYYLKLNGETEIRLSRPKTFDFSFFHNLTQLGCK